MLLLAVLIGGLDILQYKAAIMYMGEVKKPRRLERIG
jgi:hypothetical protein